ncbi:lipopolysaccharide biosynthesis protein [Alloalcanivorax marinus]|uniref:lipopolysaccharide biosynthesis protein n=1 Tax=Alloalcanivorax marinus TaxID=1177169 RepID=UPI001933BE7C|nr:oligosaccharide flippase family protein [Alloalcanivorax marinus]MBL7251758.1 oligosaccharide flippase family protein [Alloalcanivorax marinus]
MLKKLLFWAKGPIARSSIHTTFIFGFRVLFQAIHIILLARLLGASQFGVLAAIMASALLLGKLATMGTQYPLLRAAAKENESEEKTLSYAIPTTIFSGLFIFIIFFTATHYLTSDYNNLEIWPVIAIGLAELIGAPLITLFAMTQLGKNNVAASQAIQSAPLGFRVLAISLIFISPPTNPLMVYAGLYLLAPLFVLSTIIYTRPTEIPRPRLWRCPTSGELRESISFSIMDITSAAPSEIDKAIAPSLIGAGLSGVYTVAARTTAALTMPITALMLSALPRLLRGENENRLLTLTILSATAYSIIISLPLWIAAPWVHLLFGPGYAGIEEILRILCFGVPAMTLRIVSNNTLLSLSKPASRTWCEAAGIVFFLGASIPLTLHLKAVGLATSYMLSQWITATTGLLIIVITIRRKSED